MTKEIHCRLPSVGHIDNMSAPPRSTVTVRPLCVPPQSPARAQGNAAPQPPNSGLRLVTRVDLDGLLETRIPGLWDSTGPMGRVREGGMSREKAAWILDQSKINHRRVAATLLLARQLTEATTPDLASLRRTLRVPTERLEDELCERLRTIDGSALSLPAVGVIKKWLLNASRPDTSVVEDDVRRALFIACHRYGPVFVRDADPLVAGTLSDCVCVIDLLAASRSAQ